MRRYFIARMVPMAASRQKESGLGEHGDAIGPRRTVTSFSDRVERTYAHLPL